MANIMAKRNKVIACFDGGNGELLMAFSTCFFKQERAAANRYAVVCSSEHVLFAMCPTSRWRVHLQAKTCSCHGWFQRGIPCHHAITMAKKVGRMENYAKFLAWAFDPMYLMSTLVAILENASLEPPIIEEITCDKTVLPKINAKQPGRPRKRHMRSACDTAAGGGVVPQKKQQVCSR